MWIVSFLMRFITFKCKCLAASNSSDLRFLLCVLAPAGANYRCKNILSSLQLFLRGKSQSKQTGTEQPCGRWNGHGRYID